MATKKLKHRAMIASLESKMFPFLESEEEQESFTDVGRQRVDAWLNDVMFELTQRVFKLTQRVTRLERQIKQLQQVLQSHRFTKK